MHKSVYVLRFRPERLQIYTKKAEQLRIIIHFTSYNTKIIFIFHVDFSARMAEDEESSSLIFDMFDAAAPLHGSSTKGRKHR